MDERLMSNTVHFIVACLVHRLILSNDFRLTREIIIHRFSGLD